MQQAHNAACAKILGNSGWTSHTVIVVDQSGSMRKTDVEGGSTRSDAVWLTLALDFVRKQLESGDVTLTDVVSIIVMNSASCVVVDRQPTDWLLFNRVIDLLRSQEPSLDGNYGPALNLAEELLLLNTEGSCALTLFFLSDGRPSDKILRGSRTGTFHSQMVSARMDTLAGRFGRRLAVVAVGFGRPGEDFGVLETLASRPSKFGSSGKFHAANLNAESLGVAFSSLVSSLTATKTELTELGGSTQRAVRDVHREAHDTEDEHFLTEEWYPFTVEYLISREIWSVADHRWKTVALRSDAATGVAYRKKYFGEGAERIVAKFRELDGNANFVGPMLVAKESRFQLSSNEDPKNFHKVFCDTQGRAQALAEEFNRRLLDIPGVQSSTPRIKFLDCSVYTVWSDAYGGEVGVLVEEQLDHLNYKKWNDNKGGINGRAPEIIAAAAGVGLLGAMAAIAESDEEEESDDEENPLLSLFAAPASAPIIINDADIPQAFSHFTYRYTKRTQLVCDLQGVFDSAVVPPTFKFTDPVIHYTSSSGKKNVFGRTDRGKNGTHDFFKTHKCSELCRMLNRKWVRSADAKK
jgi:hypothetical protein